MFSPPAKFWWHLALSTILTYPQFAWIYSFESSTGQLMAQEKFKTTQPDFLVSLMFEHASLTGLVLSLLSIATFVLGAFTLKNSGLFKIIVTAILMLFNFLAAMLYLFGAM